MSTKNTKVIHFQQAGGPEVLKLENVKIAQPGPDEVRINIKAAGVNRIDLLFRMGLVMPPKYPSKIGFEGSGIIESVGSNVTDFKPGDEVSIVPAFSNEDYGTYGELVLMPAYAVQHKPQSLSFQEAASVWTSFSVAYGMLVDSSHLQAGQTVLLNAASSSVGLAAIQIANLLGANTIALTTSPSKKEILLKLGAQHVIVTSEENIPERVKEITNHQGAHVILDAVGGKQFDPLVKSAALRAKIYAYGYLTHDQGIYDSVFIAANMLTITGYNSEDLFADPVKLKAAIEFIKKGLDANRLKPFIAKTFPLEQAGEAHRYMASNQHIGKIVLVN